MILRRRIDLRRPTEDWTDRFREPTDKHLIAASVIVLFPQLAILAVEHKIAASDIAGQVLHLVHGNLERHHAGRRNLRRGTE